MAYELTALVARPDVLARTIDRRPVTLHGGFGLIPLEPDWFAAFDIRPSDLDAVLTVVGSFVEDASEHGPVAYLHLETFGGTIDQTVVVWTEGVVALAAGVEDADDPLPSNDALRLLGVVACDGLDEFATLGLGRHRETEEWLAEP
jgi:hypothetical protein